MVAFDIDFADGWIAHMYKVSLHDILRDGKRPVRHHEPGEPTDGQKTICSSCVYQCQAGKDD